MTITRRGRRCGWWSWTEKAPGMEGERVTWPGLLIGATLLALAALGVAAGAVARALWIAAAVVVLISLVAAVRSRLG